MSHELLYTSVPPGLIPGVKGYCTVARTAGLPDPLVPLLERHLSDYRYGPVVSPVVWSHLRITEGYGEYSVLSRKASVADHSGRASLFAHHALLGPEERPAGGPAWVLWQRSAGGDPAAFMDTEWGASSARSPPAGSRPPAIARQLVAPPGSRRGWTLVGRGALVESFLGEQAGRST